MTSCLNYINGTWQPSRNGALFDQKNPADLTEITGQYQDSTVEDAKEAIASAGKAFQNWKKTPPAGRAKYLRRVLDGMESRLEEIALQITLENGKTLAESRAEIQSAIAEMDFQIGEGLRLYGKTVPSARDDIFAYSIRRPLGVVSVITPWNFPWNVPGRKGTPALMAGNTVVFKPASLTPGTGLLFTDLFAEADFPPGVINFITGGGSTVGHEMTGNPLVKAISFTGSTYVGHSIHESAAKALIRTLLEMGGKNPLVVLSDADLDAAVDACCQAAFACAGQWCTSTSRAIVEKTVYEQFVSKVIDRAKSISVGNGRAAETEMGPVCGEKQMNGILGYIETGKREGSTLVCGGYRIEDGHLSKGCFIAPTVFVDVKPAMTVAREEIFGPVLSILCVDSLDDAMLIANDIPYGLSSSIFTRDISSALRFAEESDVGLTHVNLMTAYKEPSLCFGGIKHSGAGLPEAGQAGIEFFTDTAVQDNCGFLSML